MNIAFLLKPKSRVTYLTEASSFRQGMEKLRRSGYTSLPVISCDGHYKGCVSEGDFLWNILGMGSLNPRDWERARIEEIVSGRIPPVRVTAAVEDVFGHIPDGTFVPIIDDRDMFMGIVTHRAVWEYAKGGHIMTFFQNSI